MRRQRLRTVAGLVRLLRPYSGGEGPRVAAGAAVSIALVLLQVARPWPLKWLVDLASADGATHVPAWARATAMSPVALLAGLFVIIAVLGATAEWMQVMTLNGVANRVLYRFRRALFAHVLAQPLAFHARRDAGELLTRVVSDTARLRRGAGALLVNVLPSLALFVATLAVVLAVAPALGGVLAIAGAGALLVMRRRGRRIAKAARRQRRKEGALAALVGDELARVRELQLHAPAASPVVRRFGADNDGSLRREQKVRRLAAGLTWWVDVMVALGLAAALAAGASQVASGGLTAGDLVLFLTYALQLRHPFVTFAHEASRLGRTYACADRLARLAHRDAAPADASPAPVLRGDLRLHRVSVAAPKDARDRRYALEKLTFDVPAGRRVAVVGGNGAGKSALVHLLLQLVEPARGSVSLDGRDARDHALASLRAQVSFVLQDVAFPTRSVRELITLGHTGVDEGAVRRAAERARVNRFVERLPDGYDTVIRRGGELLSAGERRRLALAAALLRDGRIWLLDEPTSGLDPATAAGIEETLLEATRGRTTLWTTHDPALVARLDWVVRLKRGRLAYSGPSSEYLAQAASAATSRSGAPTPLAATPDGARGTAPSTGHQGTPVPLPLFSLES